MRDHDRYVSLLTVFAILLLGPVFDRAVLAQQWVSKGPAPAFNGQTENIPQSPVAGAIETVVAHPTNPDVLWIGAVNGGVFRTDNATAAEPTWVPLTDDQESLSIGALELDPTDSTHNTLVAGIGRTSSFATIGGSRTGLLRTTDAGGSWTALTGMAGRNISGVAPRGGVLVVAVENADDFACDEVGIWRSTNTGSSFTQISNNPGVTGLPCGRSFDLASDPTDNSRLFAPVTALGTSSDGIYRSTDAGATWTKVSDATMDSLLISFPSRVEISVGHAGGASANVYVAICGDFPNSRLVGLFRSGDAGSTWTALDLPQTTEQGTSYGIHPGAQCSRHLSLFADPADPNVVYIGGDRQPANNENGSLVPTFPNSIGASAFGGRLFRVDASQAAGSQATPITNCPTALTGCGGSARTANDTAPHADSREMVFDANGDLIQTDDGGIYRHTDPSGTTGDWESVVGNLAVIEQHDSALDTISNIVFSGNQDNGTTQQNTPASPVWNVVFGGDGGDVAVAADDPVTGQSTRYLSAQNFAAAHRRIFASDNVQQAIFLLMLTPLSGSPAPTFQFITPIEANEADPTRLILGAKNGTYESTDRLDSVTRISTAVVNPLTEGPIAYGVPGNADVLYFGSGDQVFSRTSPPPTAPVASDPDGTSTDSIFDLVIDPDDASTAFAIDTDQVFWTTNAGANWSDVTGNLQTLSPGVFRSVEYIGNGGDRLAVGSSKGVFAATETSGFATWSLLGNGLPKVQVLDLDYDPAGDVLAAGLLGRGAWTLFPTIACMDDLVLANQTLAGTQFHQAAMTATLGPNLVVDGTSFVVLAPTVTIVSGTEIGGNFSAGNNPSCP